MHNYRFLLSSVVLADAPAVVREGMRAAVVAGSRDPYALGATASQRDFNVQLDLRSRAIAAWRAYFMSFDAFLSPVCFVSAFAHDHTPSLAARTLKTVAGARPYTGLTAWISPATLTGCPATSMPIARTAQGLPVGLQIVGPYLEDATPLDIAQKLSRLHGDFQPPPGFAPLTARK